MKPSELCIANCSFIIGKTIKTLGFQNNTHLLDQSSLNVSSSGVFRTLSNIEVGVFFKNIYQPLAVNYFRKLLHFRYLRRLRIRSMSWHNIQYFHVKSR